MDKTNEDVTNKSSNENSMEKKNYNEVIVWGRSRRLNKNARCRYGVL